jgi:hypothetical protein
MGDALAHLPVGRGGERTAAAGGGEPCPGRFAGADFPRLCWCGAGKAPSGSFRGAATSAGILTCFLEYGDGFVNAHDLLHTRTSEGWQQAVSSLLRKLHGLDRHAVAAELSGFGLAIIRHEVERGLVTLLARKPAA